MSPRHPAKPVRGDGYRVVVPDPHPAVLADVDFGNPSSVHLEGRAARSLLERARDAVARTIIKDGGYGEYFSHGLGHGVGIEIHEGPRVSFRSSERLAPGVVVTVEPGIYLPGKGGVRIEDLVIVTESGCDVLTTSPKELKVLSG